MGETGPAYRQCVMTYGPLDISSQVMRCCHMQLSAVVRVPPPLPVFGVAHFRLTFSQGDILSPCPLINFSYNVVSCNYVYIAVHAHILI